MVSKSKFYFILLLLFLITTLFFPFQMKAEDDIDLQTSIRKWIYIKSNVERFELNNSLLFAEKEMLNFYEKRNFRPVWVNKNGFLPRGRKLFSLLSRSEEQGLNPKDYHLSDLINLWMKLNDKDSKKSPSQILTHIDLFLTDAFFIFTSDLHAGRVDPEKFTRKWVKKSSLDLINFLNNILQENNIEKIPQLLNPEEKSFKQLHDFLGEYESLQKNQELIKVNENYPLAPGDQNKQVNTLRKRLQQEFNQNISLDTANSEYFGENLKKAVKNFQKRFGLETTGKADKETLKTLNIDIEHIKEKIKLNMERWRWLPQNLGDRYILVNIPSFKLEVLENKQKIMEMKAIIGKTHTQTPVFSSRITHLVFSPRWYIPRSIAVRDYLPEVKKDISYLKNRNIKVYKQKEGSFSRVNPEEIEWDKVTKANFDYYFWQDPGPWNSLGNVIFKLPNAYDIYLHDTPQASLFNNRVRNFSSGCIRLQEAMKLALYLLQNNSTWDREKINKTVENRNETSVFLSQSIPVHILYWTVWIDQNHQLNYRKDLYNRDEKLKNVILN